MSVDYSQLTHLQVDLHGADRRIGARSSQVFRKGVHDMEGVSKAMAPVDTGALVNSIGTEFGGAGGELWAEIGPTVEHGLYQEYGTSEQPGQPYLRPACDQVMPGLMQALEKVAAGSVLGGKG